MNKNIFGSVFKENALIFYKCDTTLASYFETIHVLSRNILWIAIPTVC